MRSASLNAHRSVDRYLPAQPPTVSSDQFLHLVKNRAVTLAQIEEEEEQGHAEAEGGEEAPMALNGESPSARFADREILNELRKKVVRPKPSMGWLGTSEQYALASRALAAQHQAEQQAAEVLPPSQGGSSNEQYQPERAIQQANFQGDPAWHDGVSASQAAAPGIHQGSAEHVDASLRPELKRPSARASNKVCPVIHACAVMEVGDIAFWGCAGWPAHHACWRAAWSNQIRCGHMHGIRYHLVVGADWLVSF
jgi:hypothetical protein